MENTVIIILGSVIGILFLLVLFFMSKNRALSRQLGNTNEKLDGSEKNLKQAEITIGVLEQEKKNNEDQKEEHQKALKNQLKLIGAEILEDNSEKYSKSAAEKIEALLKPFRENIEKFRKEFESEGKERFFLGKKVEELMNLNTQLSEDAQNLTQALKGDSKMMGDWGELILERILEGSGLEYGREYFLQSRLVDSNDQQGQDFVSRITGKKLIPDAVVVYPDKRFLIIDSKVSIKAFAESFKEGLTKQEHNRLLDSHVKSIKNHIKDLNKKAYHQVLNSPEFVIMFIPNENAFNAAITTDPNLWEEAYQKRVILMNPIYLQVTLKIVVDIWERKRINENAQNIAKQGAEVYEKMAGISESIEQLGGSLKGTWKNYDLVVRQLAGHGGLTSKVEKLKEMSVQPTKELKFKDEIGQLEEKGSEPEVFDKAMNNLKTLKPKVLDETKAKSTRGGT